MPGTRNNRAQYNFYNQPSENVIALGYVSDLQQLDDLQPEHRKLLENIALLRGLRSFPLLGFTGLGISIGALSANIVAEVMTGFVPLIASAIAIVACTIAGAAIGALIGSTRKEKNSLINGAIIGAASGFSVGLGLSLATKIPTILIASSFGAIAGFATGYLFHGGTITARCGLKNTAIGLKQALGHWLAKEHPRVAKLISPSSVQKYEEFKNKAVNRAEALALARARARARARINAIPTVDERAEALARALAARAIAERAARAIAETLAIARARAEAKAGKEKAIAELQEELTHFASSSSQEELNDETLEETLNVPGFGELEIHCPVYFTVMQNPIVTVPSGHSYDHSTLVKYPDNTCPTTRAPIEGFYPNHNLREFIQRAAKYQQGKDGKAFLETIPPEFVCPITQKIMTDPVILANGTSYEKAQICDFISNPIATPKELSKFTPERQEALITNYALKSLIDACKPQIEAAEKLQRARSTSLPCLTLAPKNKTSDSQPPTETYRRPLAVSMPSFKLNA